MEHEIITTETGQQHCACGFAQALPQDNQQFIIEELGNHLDQVESAAK